MLLDIKAAYNQDTQKYGLWVAYHMPKIRPSDKSYSQTMAYNQAIIEPWATENKPGLNNPQAIVQAYERANSVKLHKDSKPTTSHIASDTDTSNPGDSTSGSEGEDVVKVKPASTHGRLDSLRNAVNVIRDKVVGVVDMEEVEYLRDITGHLNDILNDAKAIALKNAA